MPRLRKPRALPRGGTIGLAAPASALDMERIAIGEKRWRDAGFSVVYRDDIGARHRYLAGDDARRAAELHELWSDPRVDAVVCARGGWGCHRIMDRLDPDLVRSAAKPLLGYSDVTTLLLWQRRAVRLVGFHGPMLERPLADDEFDAVIETLTGTDRLPVVRAGSEGGGGSAEGPLIGGSLTLVAASLGTPWAIDARGAVLLLEDVGERPYRIDRLLEQLRCAGVLEQVAALGFGRFERCDEPDASITAAEILRECAARAGVPWVAGLPFGHGAPNLIWPFGVRARLDGDRATLQILERGVA